MNARDPLVSADGAEVLECSIVFLAQDDGRLVLLDGDLLVPDSLHSVHNQVGDDAVNHIYQVLFIWQGIVNEVGKVHFDLAPISSRLSTQPDALGIEFGPTREMLHPLHISLL